MTIQPDLPMDDNDRCWAYSPEMERCEGYAGHDGDHFINRSWTNSECWTPNKPSSAPTIIAIGGGGASGSEHMRPGPPKMCICEHPMHLGECPLCDCKSGIEA